MPVCLSRIIGVISVTKRTSDNGSPWRNPRVGVLKTVELLFMDGAYETVVTHDFINVIASTTKPKGF